MEATLIRMRHHRFERKKASTLAKKRTKEMRIGVPFDYIEPLESYLIWYKTYSEYPGGWEKTQTVKQSSEKTRTTTSIPKYDDRTE